MAIVAWCRYLNSVQITNIAGVHEATFSRDDLAGLSCITILLTLSHIH